MVLEIPVPTNSAKIKYIFDFTPNDLLVPLDTPLIKSLVHGSSHQFSTARKTPPRIETAHSSFKLQRRAQVIRQKCTTFSSIQLGLAHGVQTQLDVVPAFRSLITQLGRLVQTNDYFLFAGLWADHQGLVSHSGDSTKPCRLSNRPGKRAEIGEWLDFFFNFFIFVSQEEGQDTAGTCAMASVNHQVLSLR